MTYGVAAEAALLRAGDAVDDAIVSLLASVEGGQGTRKDQSLLLVDPQLHRLLTMSPQIRSSVEDFLNEFGRSAPGGGTRQSDQNTQEKLARALVGLEAALLRLKEAVEWTAKHSGEHWWIKRRQRDLALSSFVVLARPGNGQEWLTSPLIGGWYDLLVELGVLSDTDIDLERLENVRLITVPRFDGMDARWHPISLGHEIAHLVFTPSWVEHVLCCLGEEPAESEGLSPQATWCIDDASREPHGRNHMFQRVSSWLAEVACDTCMRWFYGDEGVRALEFFLGMALDRDTERHPPPQMRVGLQLNAGGRAAVVPGDSPRERVAHELAFMDLAPKIIDAARRELDARTSPHFQEAESGAVLDAALSALRAVFSPPCQTWSPEIRRDRPSSIETGLVRCLWSIEQLPAGEDAGESEPEAYYVSDESARNRVEHAVNALEFSHLFSRGVSDLGKEDVLKDGLEVNSVLWVKEAGIFTDSEATPGTGSVAVDVRLGRHFIVFRRNRISSLDFLEDSARVETMQEMIEVSWGKSLVLHPGELVLGVTFESLVVAQESCAQILSRSSLGRLGLLAATAVHVQPGFRGNLTLELVNLTSVPLRLTPGQRIAQVVALPAAGDSDYSGGYQDANWRPRFSKVGGDEETEILIHMFEDQVASIQGDV